MDNFTDLLATCLDLDRGNYIAVKKRKEKKIKVYTIQKICKVTLEIKLYNYPTKNLKISSFI